MKDKIPYNFFEVTRNFIKETVSPYTDPQMLDQKFNVWGSIFYGEI